jgi:hypothetical protein
MPDPSPGSIDASVPDSSDARNELTRCTRLVALYRSGECLKNRLI